MAHRNRTLQLTEADVQRLQPRLQQLPAPLPAAQLKDSLWNQTLESALPHLPAAFADVLFLDPPYNQPKQFGSLSFAAQSAEAYEAYVLGWLRPLLRCLKPEGSVYLCGDWRSAAALPRALAACGLHIRNRISWEREKGRGARRNWKNASEDLWYATCGEDYYFSVSEVKLRRRVRAPYRLQGQPKDWQQAGEHKYRDTHPSNLWTDLSVPFWSMPENTPHPTQKPEKLLAKVLLASCPPGGWVLDPFAGSGTTAVVARKLGRHFVAIEAEPDYCLWALRRLEIAADQTAIQGYDGVFWERNTRPL